MERPCWNFKHEVQTQKKLQVYHQYGVFVDDKYSQHAESDWLTVQTAQEHN